MPTPPHRARFGNVSREICGPVRRRLCWTRSRREDSVGEKIVLVTFGQQLWDAAKRAGLKAWPEERARYDPTGLDARSTSSHLADRSIQLLSDTSLTPAFPVKLPRGPSI